MLVFIAHYLAQANEMRMRCKSFSCKRFDLEERVTVRRPDGHHQRLYLHHRQTLTDDLCYQPVFEYFYRLKNIFF